MPARRGASSRSARRRPSPATSPGRSSPGRRGARVRHRALIGLEASCSRLLAAWSPSSPEHDRPLDPAATARPVDRRRCARRVRRGPPLAAHPARRGRLRPAGDPHVLGHLPVPPGRLGRPTRTEAELATAPGPPVGGRDRHLVRRLARCWRTGSTPGSASRRRPCCCRSSTWAASGCGSSPSRSRPPRSFRFTQQVTQRGLSNAAWSAFYNVVPRKRRPRSLAFNDGVPGQLGTVLSGILLLAAGTLLARDQVFWLGRSRRSSARVVVIGVRRRYLASVLGRLRAGLAEQVLEGGPGLAALVRDPTVSERSSVPWPHPNRRSGGWRQACSGRHRSTAPGPR